MKIKKLDDQRDITSTGFLIQRKTKRGTRYPLGAVYQPPANGTGYQYVKLFDRKSSCPLHRVVWEAFNGPIPEGMQVDHINGKKDDNRLENLRLATSAENLRAHAKVRKGSTSRYRGVVFFANKWRARIRHNGKDLHVGMFVSEVAAALARDIKALELGYPVEGTNFFSAA